MDQPTTGPGVVTVTNGSQSVSGQGTEFTNTFKLGDSITVGTQTRTISAITDDFHLTVSSVFTISQTSSYTLTGGTRLAVKGNGNIGIGTTSPSGKLTVQGGTPDAGDLFNVNNAAGQVIGRIYPDGSNNGVLHVRDSDGNVNIQLYSHPLGSSYFTCGNVGIGVTSPTAKLDVDPGTLSNTNPNIRLRGVRSTVPSGGQNGDIQIYDSGSTRRLYIKINNSWRYVNLT